MTETLNTSSKMEQKVIDAKFKADVYEAGNELQRRDGIHLLENLKERFAGRKLQTVIDVGSGCGNLTSLISQYLDCSEVIGMDISVDMVEHAQKTYAGPNLRFEVANIAENFDDLFKKLKIATNVDLIVSIHCLHWVKEKYPETFSNMFGLLSPGRTLKVLNNILLCKFLGGEGHFLLAAGNKAAPLWVQVLRSPTWIKYFPEAVDMTEEDAWRWIFPSPKSEMGAWKAAASDLGFTDINLEILQTKYIFESLKHFYALCEGIGGYVFERIPANERKDFYLSFLHSFCDQHADQDCYPKYCFNYDLAIMQVIKPGSNNNIEIQSSNTSKNVKIA